MKDNDCRTKPRARTTGTPGDRTGPSLDTLDSLVRRCGSCRYDPRVYGICKRCIDYDQWTLPNYSLASEKPS